MYLSEIFFGWQGEGLWAGAPQVFVRFEGCPLRCAYCDTPDSLKRSPGSFCATRAGECDSQPLVQSQNPVTIHWALSQVKRLSELRGPLHSVSMTGGEPLAQGEFLAELARRLRQEGFRTYLETAGILPEIFGRIASLCDWVAMDLKLPSATGGGARWDEHEAFLSHADPSKTFVKTVVTGNTSDEDVEQAALLVAGRSARIPFFLQPATPVWKGIEPPSLEQIRRWTALATPLLTHVYVASQWHRPKGPLHRPVPALLLSKHAS